MPDSGRPGATHGDNPAPAGPRRNKQLPELVEQVRQTDIPLLAQPVTAVASAAELPALEETFTLFEKNVPVLEEVADPVDQRDSS